MATAILTSEAKATQDEIDLFKVDQKYPGRYGDGGLSETEARVRRVYKTVESGIKKGLNEEPTTERRVSHGTGKDLQKNTRAIKRDQRKPRELTKGMR